MNERDGSLQVVLDSVEMHLNSSAQLQIQVQKKARITAYHVIVGDGLMNVV